MVVVVTSQTPIQMILKNPPPLPLSTGSSFEKERTGQHWQKTQSPRTVHYMPVMTQL